MNIVALILGDIRNPFYADLAFNIQRILNDNSYMVMVLNSEYNIERELEFLKLTEQFNFAGYRQVMQNYGLPFEENFVFESDLKLETGRSLADDFCKLEKRPSAMVIVNDMTAIGFMDGCRNAGIRIPEDLSIVSFDNIAMASMYGIELTTISQHVDEMGEKAAHLMLKQLNDKDAKPERIIMEPTLIVRKTTCKHTES